MNFFLALILKGKNAMLITIRKKIYVLDIKWTTSVI